MLVDIDGWKRAGVDIGLGVFNSFFAGKSIGNSVGLGVTNRIEGLTRIAIAQCGHVSSDRPWIQYIVDLNPRSLKNIVV